MTYKGYHSRIVSNLSMSAHVSLSTNYKCLFVVSNGALCARRSPIIFEGKWRIMIKYAQSIWSRYRDMRGNTLYGQLFRNNVVFYIFTEL